MYHQSPVTGPHPVEACVASSSPPRWAGGLGVARYDDERTDDDDDGEDEDDDDDELTTTTS